MLNELAKLIEQNGGTAYLVGGKIRDEILGIESKDTDIEVFGMLDYRLHAVLLSFALQNDLKFSLVGKSFQVFKLRDTNGNEIDVSLPRRDVNTGKGHKDFKVVADPFMSTFEASSRRDFTINSLMKNLHTGEIIDHFNGRQDLQNKVIRMTSPDAFADDPLRALRAVQFASRFQFTIHQKTLEAMSGIDLRELPAERVFTEVEKILMKSPKPSWGIEWLVALWPEFFRELEDLRDVEQDAEWHPEGTVLTHTKMVVDEAAKIIRYTSAMEYPQKLTLMLAALCHDFGKATTTEKVWEHTSSMLCVDECSPHLNHRCLDDVGGNMFRIRAHGHSQAGLEPTERFLNRINVHSVDGYDVRGQVLALVEHHLAPAQLMAAKEKDKGTNLKSAIRRLSTKVQPNLLAWVSLADQLGRDVSKEKKDKSIDEISQFLVLVSEVGIKPPEPILKGRHLIKLGMKPSKDFGRILDAVFELQLSGQINNLEQALEYVSSSGIGVALE